MFKNLFLPVLGIVALGFSSCTKEETGGCPDGSATDSLRIQLSTDTVEKNGFDYVNIKVTDKNGLDVTAKCNIYANNSLISKNYVPVGLGTQTITASTDCQVSESKNLVVTAVSASPFTQKALVEDLTGAWCGFCTRVSHSLDSFKATKSQNLIVVTVHGGGGTDPFKYQYYTQINSKYKLSGYPSVLLNRKVEWNESHSTLTNALNSWAPLGISINSLKNNDGTVSGTVKVKYNVNTERPMKLVIAMVENGLIAPQENYYSTKYGYKPYLYGAVSPINNFVHNGVLRKTSTDLFGDVIPVETQKKGNIYSKDFTLILSGKTYDQTPYTANIDNVGIVAFVIDDSGNNYGIYNVQYANAGTDKDFD